VTLNNVERRDGRYFGFSRRNWYFGGQLPQSAWTS